jgi:hypothetical protein
MLTLSRGEETRTSGTEFQFHNFKSRKRMALSAEERCHLYWGVTLTQF